MRLRSLAVGVCSAAAALSTLTSLSPGLSPAAEARTRSTTLKVASFNISTVTFDRRSSGAHRPWRVRRTVIVSQIMSRRPDVIGLQEANQSNIYRRSLDFGANQFMDLRNALRRRGGSYQVTNQNPYNCRHRSSSQHCRYSYRGAAQDNRILYNTRTLRMVHQGGVRYHRQSAGKNPRYLAWAVFRSRVNGKRFLFTDTHLDPYNARVRKAQWRQSISITNRLRRGRLVVAVGDYNTSKFDRYARTYLPRMRRAGYGDVLNQVYRQPVVHHRRAASTRHAWLNSYNGWHTDIRRWAYEDARDKVGNHIDWIFASNSMRVRSWETVANVNEHRNRVIGILPSDHNMVLAGLSLR